jgi:hypothetical protein
MKKSNVNQFENQLDFFIELFCIYRYGCCQPSNDTSDKRQTKTNKNNANVVNLICWVHHSRTWFAAYGATVATAQGKLSYGELWQTSTPQWLRSNFGSLLPQPQNFLFVTIRRFFFKVLLRKEPKYLLRYARTSIERGKANEWKNE